MVDGIRGRGGSLEREAILAAMKAQAHSAAGVRDAAAAASEAVAARIAGAGGADEAAAPDFAARLEEGIQAVNAEVRAAESLPEDLVAGRVADLSEVATRLKSAELSFRFSMEIRNKLIDAYREVMRMQV